MRFLAFCFLAVLVWAPHARADDCSNPGSQMELNDCAAASAKTSDAALNTTYADIRRRLKNDPATTKLLIKAQKAWIAFRDSECDFVASKTAGGSINGMIYNYCLSRLTETRLADLKTYLQCKEGDLSCPVPSQ